MVAHALLVSGGAPFGFFRSGPLQRVGLFGGRGAALCDELLVCCTGLFRLLREPRFDRACFLQYALRLKTLFGRASLRVGQGGQHLIDVGHVVIHVGSEPSVTC